MTSHDDHPRAHGHAHDHDDAGGDRPAIERHADVVVVGGSAAGLAAALQLGRQRRSVIVVDGGEPRNAPAHVMHSFLGRDGTPPTALTEAGREEVRSYGGEILAGTVGAVARTDDGRFRVEVSERRVVLARRVIAATGIADELPDIAGLAEHWGVGVIHCPFCHGYEERDRRIVQIVTHPMGLHPAALFRQLTDRLTVVVHDDTGIDDALLAPLRAAGVEVLVAEVARVLADADGEVAGLELVDGRRLDADTIAIGPRFRARIDPFVGLGLTTSPHPSGLGEVVVVDPAGATEVPGLHAAGNLTDPSQQVLAAAAAGSWVGGQIAFALAHEDLLAGARSSANADDWDARYGGDLLWSGNPNGSLVAEVGRLAERADHPGPGRALDVGAGEGGDAVWLAEQGWSVTANDVSANGLARVAAEADRRGLAVEVRHADANARDPFGDGDFDLVTASYASIPRTPDDRAVRNLLAAVAPGGTLLVISHDLAPMRTPAGVPDRPMGFDPDAYVRVEDVARVVEATPGWEVEVHETRTRPPGAASASHHVDDVVLRARRTV